MNQMIDAADLGGAVLIEAQRAALSATLGGAGLRALMAHEAGRVINWKENAV
ncbi:hypothetical protein D3C83_108890 [compost metagenome]